MRKRKVAIMLDEGAQIPFYATELSAGADVKCNEDFTLNPGEHKLIHTGIRMELPDDMECQVRPRSGLAAKYGITVINAPGTIDADYQGECNVLLINHGTESVSFAKGERIAQFVFVENVVQAEFDLALGFTKKTERGEGGFGHTGKK